MLYEIFLKKVVPYLTYLGTRPPTLDEWEKYELHHRARLAIKPGIPAFLREVRCKWMRLLFAAIFIVMYVVAVSYGMTQNEWYDAIPYHFYFDYM